MKSPGKIKTLFLDIGGVLLTDGWQTGSRKLAAKAFRLDFSETEERHRMVFDTYEEGKLTLEEYLTWVVFYKKRSFTRTKFRKFMFAQSKPYPEMVELVRQLKAKHGLKIIVLSNEARELNAYRINKFKLDGFVDAFVSSCFVHLRKPDADIFRLRPGHRPDAGAPNRLHRKHRDVCSDRGKHGHSRHRAQELQFNSRAAVSVGVID